MRSSKFVASFSSHSSLPTHFAQWPLSRTPRNTAFFSSRSFVPALPQAVSTSFARSCGRLRVHLDREALQRTPQEFDGPAAPTAGPPVLPIYFCRLDTPRASSWTCLRPLHFCPKLFCPSFVIAFVPVECVNSFRVGLGDGVDRLVCGKRSAARRRCHLASPSSTRESKPSIG